LLLVVDHDAGLANNYKTSELVTKGNGRRGYRSHTDGSLSRSTRSTTLSGGPFNRSSGIQQSEIWRNRPSVKLLLKH